MELNSKITFYPNGSYEILIEEGKDSGFFIGVSMEELKQMATAYAESSKKRKEVLKKEVEASKKIGKKAIVKAFLKKAVKKRMAKKENLRILKETIDAGKKALKTHVRGFSRSDNDASQFWSAVELKMKSADSNSRAFEFIRDWFYDVLSYPVKEVYGGGFATKYTEAPKDYIESILSGIYKAHQKKGSLIEVWNQDIEPPYGSRVSYSDIEKFEDLFPTLYVEDEMNPLTEDLTSEEMEELDPEDEPYKYSIYVRIPK